MKYDYEDNVLDFQTVIAQLAAKYDWNAFLASPSENAVASVPKDLWKQIQEVGLRGLTLDAELGGEEASWQAMAAAGEAIAAGPIPAPVLAEIVAVEGLLASSAGLSDDVRKELVARYLGENTTSGAKGASEKPAVVLRAGNNDPIEYQIEVSGSSVHGTLDSVIGLAEDSQLILPAFSDGQLELVLVDGAGSIEDTNSFDHSRALARVNLVDAPIIMHLASGAPAARAWAALLR